jgi:pimeloyl-ACP methyl ester carboxylesterase
VPDITANGITLHYEERGAGDPLVIIVGLGSDGTNWAPHLDLYEKHFRTILINNRGAGLSDKPEGPYSSTMMADDAAAVMDAAGIDKAHVIGISMGGTITQQLALNHPERVRTITLACTWAKCNNYAATVFEHMRKAREVCTPDRFHELLQLWLVAPSYYDMHWDELRQAQRDTLEKTNPMPYHAFSAQCDACLGHDSTARLGELDVPTLITVGVHDIFTPPAFSEYLQQNIRGAEYCPMENSGHYHYLEALDLFNSKTTSFMQAH